MVTLRVTLLLAFPSTFFAMGCEPELGAPCDDSEDKVNAVVDQLAGTNNLVQDVSLENCSQGFCLSFDGSRPFCTKECVADAECAEGGVGFSCQEVVAFGPLACTDYEDPLLPRPDIESTGSECAANTDCTAASEFCFADPSPVAGTCGIPGRDCLTGDDGGQSALPVLYCAATPETILERDRQFGRAP